MNDNEFVCLIMKWIGNWILMYDEDDDKYWVSYIYSEDAYECNDIGIIDYVNGRYAKVTEKQPDNDNYIRLIHREHLS